MKTPCFEREHLFAYSGRMLGAREDARVKAHLASCASCREAVAGFEKVSHALDDWKPSAPSPWFDARVRARVAASSSGRSRLWGLFGLSRLSGKAWTAATAGGAVIVVMTSLAVWGPFRPSNAQKGAQVAKNRIAVSAPPAAKTSVSFSGAQTVETASQEIALYKNLSVLENYDMLANFDVLSELPQASDKATD